MVSSLFCVFAYPFYRTGFCFCFPFFAGCPFWYSLAIYPGCSWVLDSHWVFLLQLLLPVVFLALLVNPPSVCLGDHPDDSSRESPWLSAEQSGPTWLKLFLDEPEVEGGIGAVKACASLFAILFLILSFAICAACFFFLLSSLLSFDLMSLACPVSILVRRRLL